MAVLLSVTLPFAGSAQTVAPVSMSVGADTVHREVHLDSLGVLPAPAADSVELRDHLDSLGYRFVRILSSGAWAVGLPVQLPSPDDAVEHGRALRLARPDLIREAGPLARVPGDDGAIVYVDRVIVWYHPGRTPRGQAAVEAVFGLERIDAGPDPDLVRYYLTDQTPAGYFDAIAQISADPRVDYAYPDYIVDITEALQPNDTHYGLQWHLGAGGPGSIDAEHAWDITTGDSGVVIAVLERYGFDLLHPDLSPNLWTDQGNPSVHGWNFSTTPASADFTTPTAKVHGTFVIGLAAAAGNNGIGVAGVCFGCRSMPIVMGATHLSDVILSFEWAEAHGASVINASWSLDYDAGLAAVIQDVALNGRGGKGIPVIFAAGNDATDACTTDPQQASQQEAFMVGATDAQDLLTDWSNFGDCVDVVAPGGTKTHEVSIVSTDRLGDGVLNSSQVGFRGCTSEVSGTVDYTRCAGGTSASAPIVAGAAGLMLSVNPSLTTTQVYAILRETADKVSCADALYGGVATCPTDWTARSDRYGYGRLNAFKAVQAARPVGPDCVGSDCPPPPPSASVGVEVGARLGYTSLSGSTDQDVWNLPGSGPMGDPVLHAAVVLPAFLTAKLMVELQVATSSRSQPAPAEAETLRTLAPQAALLWTFGNYQAYVGLNYAHRRHDDGLGTVTTTDAWGTALGMRRVLFGHLPIRLEGRWRNWSDGTDEFGVAAIFGVLF